MAKLLISLSFDVWAAQTTPTLVDPCSAVRCGATDRWASLPGRSSWWTSPVAGTLW